MNDVNKIIYTDNNITIFKINSSKYGLFCVNVDTEDIAIIKDYKWHIEKRGGLVRSVMASKSGGKTYRLHSLITNYKITDHIDGNPLNNCKNNLRECTRRQNGMNKKLTRKNKCGFKGVHEARGRWVSRITYNYKQMNLGSYGTKEEAARAYNEAALKYFGEFARLNDIN